MLQASTVFLMECLSQSVISRLFFVFHIECEEVQDRFLFSHGPVGVSQQLPHKW